MTKWKSTRDSPNTIQGQRQRPRWIRFWFTADCTYSSTSGAIIMVQRE